MRFHIITALALCASMVACSDSNGRAEAINKEIKQIEAQLHEFRVAELKTEVHSQPLMQDNWKEFTEEQQKAEDFNNKIEHLKKRLEELKKEREALLK